MKCPTCNQDSIDENLPCPQCGNAITSMVQDWHWLDKAPGPQSVTAGEHWHFKLPLTGSGKIPRCQWLNIPGRQEILHSEDLTLDIKIPLDKIGISKLEYRIAGYEHLNGVLMLKVIPSALTVPKTAPLTVTEAPLSTDLQDELADGTAQAPTPCHLSESITPLPVTLTQPQAPSHSADVIPARPLQPALLNPVYIQVFRGSTMIPQLKTRLEPHQSLLIGKRSDSKRIFPDINLRGHFSDSKNEGLCSRAQVSVYISKQQAFLENLGKSPLQSDSQPNPIIHGQAYNWHLNEIIRLPGDINLKLVEL